MRVYLAMLRASLASQLSYRTAFVGELLGRAWVTSFEMLGALVILSHVGTLGGWSSWEIVYLYGVGSAALGLAELLTDGLHEMPELVRLGTFDGVLLRPAPAIVQVLGRQCRLMHLGRVLQGLVALAVALVGLGRPLGPLELGMLLVNVGSPALVYAAIFVASGATAIFTVQGSEAFNAFTYGGQQMTQYPVPIYRRWLQLVFLWVVPVGLATYYPALVVLGKPDALGLSPALPYVAPIVSVVFLLLSLRYWQFAVDRYRSTGS